MPWLSRANSRRNSAENSPDGAAKWEPELQQASKLPANGAVTFIPAMIDGSCGTSPSQYRRTPIQLLLADLRVVLQNLGCLPDMVRSLCSWQVMRRSAGSIASARDIAFQCILTATELLLGIFAVPAFLFLPGLAFLIPCLIALGMIALLSWPLKGNRVVRSRRRDQSRQLDEFADERWIYVNGSMTSNRQLRSQIAQLSSIFGRQITGIHNQTNGMVVDMLESVLFRCLRLTTPVSTTLYSQLRDSLLNESVRKVIVLGHGTGAAILSSTLDNLHAELPVDVLSKLEIYTFGSSATHLSNPCMLLESPMNQHGPFTRADGSLVSPVKATLASRGYRTEDTERVITHIEHYALASDISARTGILHNTCSVLDNRFCGRIFVMNSQPGFLFSTHYLSTLFPCNSTSKDTTMLDTSVSVDVQTAEKREFTASGISMPLKSISKRLSGGSFTSPQISPKSSSSGSTSGMTKAEKRASWSASGVFGSGMGAGVDSVQQARNDAREAEGKTVRQLSRLWRYAGGGKPVGEGVSVLNGVNLNLSGLGLGMGMGTGMIGS